MLEAFSVLTIFMPTSNRSFSWSSYCYLKLSSYSLEEFKLFYLFLAACLDYRNLGVHANEFEAEDALDVLWS